MTLRDYINSKRDNDYCGDYEVWDADVDIRVPVYEDVGMTYVNDEEEHNLYLLEKWFLDLEVDSTNEYTVWVKCFPKVEKNWTRIVDGMVEDGGYTNFLSTSEDPYDDPDMMAMYVEDIFTCLSQGYYSVARDFVKFFDLEKGENMELETENANWFDAELEKAVEELKGEHMIHSVLSNLTDYVDMGVTYFGKKDGLSDNLNNIMERLTDRFYMKEIIRWLDDTDTDVKDFVTENYSLSDLVDGYDLSDLVEHVLDVGYTSDVLDEIDISDIKDYLIDHYSVSDVLDELDIDDIIRYIARRDCKDELLANVSKDDLLEFLVNNYSVGDFVSTDWNQW